MKHTKAILPFACAFSLTAAAGSTGAQDTLVSAGLAAKIDRVVTPYVVARDFMGVVAVERDGEAPLVIP